MNKLLRLTLLALSAIIFVGTPFTAGAAPSNADIDKQFEQQMEQMMENPQFQQQMDQLINNPELAKQMLAMVRSPEFKQQMQQQVELIMNNPELQKQMRNNPELREQMNEFKQAIESGEFFRQMERLLSDPELFSKFAAARLERQRRAMDHLPKAPPIDFANLRDPFSSYLTRVAARGAALIEAQRSRLLNREPEILEGFDLSTLKLVAIYRKGEDRVAMIEDATGKGYIVRRGNYMGKNNGRIEKIDNDTVHLVEQVINPAGDVVDNQVTLTLKEVNE